MKKFGLSIVIAIFSVLTLTFVLTACEEIKEIPEEELEALRGDVIERAENDVRIMSANVLVRFRSWGGEPVLSRADRFAKALEHYLPDVIGAQEFCSDWYSKLMPMIDDLGYKIIKEKYKGLTENRTPIIYNSARLELTAHGIHKYSEGDDNGCRVVSWAVFRRISDSKTFAVTSTHLDLIRPGKEQEESAIMMKQTDEFFRVIGEISEKNNCPIFMCGDYNCMEERNSYNESDFYGNVGETYAAFNVYNKIASV